LEKNGRLAAKIDAGEAFERGEERRRQYSSRQMHT
jgi:hypothetical protein